MDLFLDRSRMFSLIGALEVDLRRAIENHLLAYNFEEQILGPAFGLAVERANKDADRETTQPNLLDYLELSDEIEILNRHRKSLPDSISRSLAQHSLALQQLIPIRHRVMHTRSLLPDDSTDLESTIRSLVREGFEGPTIRETLQRLEDQPTWSPANFTPAPSGRVMHNLPMPDYDETGLIGRRRTVDDIKAELLRMGKGGRSKVLTIVGPGGLGKTAVALEALYDLVEDAQCPFDLVSWVSLKTERLTTSGVQDLVEAVRSVDEAVAALAVPLEGVTNSSIAQLSEAIELLDVNALVVIDNLETVSANEVLSMIDQLPDSVSYLFTSREGLGQVERRHELAPLDSSHAVQLLRSSFKARGLKNFASMDASAAQSAVERLGRSPLGIKWFVSGVEVGRDPAELLRRPDDLIRFCVENVFETLESDAKSTALALVATTRAITVGELRALLPDLGGDSLRRSIQSLLRRMFAIRGLVDGSMVETFEASPALVSYLRNPSVDYNEEISQLRRSDDQLRRDDDRHRVDAEGDPLRPNIIQGALDHRGLTSLLRTALSRSKAGDFSSALRSLDNAEELDPTYWEVFRVRGFILSQQGVTGEATSAYERAVALAPDDRTRAIVLYFFAGHVQRREVDSVRAEQLAMAAHEILGTARSALQYGTALTYVGRFDEAEDFLAEAIASSERQTRLIATTQLVDCLRRHAEHQVRGMGDPVSALRRLESALELVDQAADAGAQDSRLLDKAQSAAADCLRYLNLYPSAMTEVDVPQLLQRVDRYSRMHPNGRHLEHVQGALRRFDQEKLDGQAKSILKGLETKRIGSRIGVANPATAESLTGSIKVWLGGQHYGFIAADEYPANLFTHVSELVDPSDEIFLTTGTPVSFVPGVGANGQVRGCRIQVIDRSGTSLRGRQVQVLSVGPTRGFVLTIDLLSGATVFVGRHVMVPRTAWENVATDSLLEVDVEIDELGRFRAERAQPSSANS